MIASNFETRQGLGDRGTFVALKEDAPDWLLEAVREAHQGDLPNDWVFSVCLAAVERYDEGADEDSAEDFAEANADVYNGDLFQWARDSFGGSVFAYAEEEAGEMGLVGLPKNGIAEQLRVIQWRALRRIAQIIFEACEEHAED